LDVSITSGAALQKFRAMVVAQGGDARVIDDPARFPRAKYEEVLASPRSGFVCDVDAMGIALAALRLGAGRTKADGAIDPAVGVNELMKVGERVEQGAPLCRVHANDERALSEAMKLIGAAIVIGDERVSPTKLVGEVLGC